MCDHNIFFQFVFFIISFIVNFAILSFRGHRIVEFTFQFLLLTFLK